MKFSFPLPKQSLDTYTQSILKVDAKKKKSVLYTSSFNLRPQIVKATQIILMYSLLVQSVKNLPAVQETRVQSLGWEDPLEKKMATHSSILAWKISWTEEPGGLQSMGSQRVGHD